MRRGFSFGTSVFGTAVLAMMALTLLPSAMSAAEEKLAFETSDSGIVTITDGGKIFAQYRPNCLETPILWPLVSAQGRLMTRGFPMIESVDVDGEKNPELKNIFRNARIAAVTEVKDHPHHRSLWFNHGEVNDADFWAVGKKTTIRPEAPVVEKTESGQIVVKTKNVWIDENKNGEKLCEDVRTILFGVLPESGIRYIDYDINLTALAGRVVFGDTKEGSFGVRVPGPMAGDAGKRFAKWGGTILNNHGDKNDAAWAKRAGWVDYSGPVPERLDDAALDGFGDPTPEKITTAVAGITIMNHPDGFRAPSWYHVRTYGLFAVNPFGVYYFENKEKGEKKPVELKKGEKLLFRYRVLLHDGPLSVEELDRLYKDYAGK